MRLRTAYREILRDVALDQYGYVTSTDARRLGIPVTELPKIAARGGLRRVGWGMYRFDDVPVTPHDEFMEAVLLGGAGAVLSHDAVLALHGLALANPRTIRVTTPRRVRRRLPDRVVLVHRKPDQGETTVYYGLPSTTVSRALVDCVPLIRRDRLIAAGDEALAEGLLTRSEHRSVMERLHAHV
jgi:predicted transcriptional regulator of viral defense system